MKKDGADGEERVMERERDDEVSDGGEGRNDGEGGRRLHVA